MSGLTNEDYIEDDYELDDTQKMGGAGDDAEPLEQEDEAEAISDEETNVEDTAEVDEDTGEVSQYSVEYIVVKPEKRRTTSIMSKLEMTEAVSIRATQIAQYNNCFVDITGLTDPIKMAKRELMMRKCPLRLSRFVGMVTNDKGQQVPEVEYWSPNEMTFAVSYSDVV